MFNFLTPTPPLRSFDFLQVDLHSHLLPGIDDGAKDLDHSLALIRRLADMGFTQLYTTPHVMADLYPNTPDLIRAKLAEVRAAVAAAGLTIKIDAAAEYLLDEGFGAQLQAGTLLTLPGNKVLVEMSFVSEPPNLDQTIFQLQTKGYQVLLAHPERYLFLRDHFERYAALKERGVELQMNLLSLTGYYGLPTRDNAIKLLKTGLIDYLATDLHHERHADYLEQLLQDRKLSRLIRKFAGNLQNGALV